MDMVWSHLQFLYNLPTTNPVQSQIMIMMMNHSFSFGHSLTHRQSMTLLMTLLYAGHPDREGHQIAMETLSLIDFTRGRVA